MDVPRTGRAMLDELPEWRNMSDTKDGMRKRGCRREIGKEDGDKDEQDLRASFSAMRSCG
jgi:hypothetical protein